MSRRGRGSRKIDGGRWQVQRERFRIGSAEPMPDMRSATPLSSIVASIVSRYGLGVQDMLDGMSAEWGTLVGKAVAAHCRPGRLEKGELTIFVDSSVWLNELVRYSRPQLLSNLQARYGKGEVKSVRVQLDPDGPGPRRPTGAAGV